MPTPTLTNILVGQATGYTGPVNEPMPALSVALGGAWGGNWAYWGATDSGVSFGGTQNTNDIMIEEQPNPAAVTVQTADYSVSVTLAEDTLETMKLAFGGTLVVNAGATPPNKTLNFGVALNQYAVGFEGINPFGLARRFYLPGVVGFTQSQVAFRRAADKRMYAVTFRAICAPTSIQVQDRTS